MIKQNNKLNTNTTDQQPTVKNLFAGSLVVIIIAITPLLFYSYKSFPDVKIWETSFFTAETAFRSWFDYTITTVIYLVFYMQTLVALDITYSYWHVLFSNMGFNTRK